ncbi:putative ABC transporter permease/ATP-binding protein [Streptomyces sp. NBRC 110611]|uniref:ABC transporter ATP-binding protein n=1 Tax=Streptomyces sp. NBRC 110611 TaxID=1621259 RepID=UPI00085696E2|nr:putative ABC transporter permease/ATP-binding protein [Streptomyces sp. NBRC 110611]
METPATGSAASRAAPPPDPAGSTWRLLLGYVRPHRWTLLAGAVLALVTGATGLALPLVASALIDGLSHDRSVAGPLVWMSALVITNAALGALGTYVLQRTAESVVLGARRALASYLLRLRITALDRSEPGDLMARITSDSTLLSEVTTDSLVGLGTSGLTLAATLVMMGLVDPVLLLVTVGVIVGAGTVIGVIVPRITKAARHAQEAVGAMGASLERTLGALRTVKASGAEHREEQALHSAAVDSWRQSVRAAKWSALAGNTAGLSMQIAFITVLAVGGARVATGAIDIATLVAFLLYVFYLMSPIQQVVTAVTQYQSGAAALSRIQEALHLPAEPSARPAPLPEPAAEPAALAFDDVCFRYADDLPHVHHGVSFTVPACGMTAFVGPSGAGKTTVFALIERFYDPTSGRIALDGRDLTDWDISHLRSAIGYVEQDAPVLSGSLRDNLLLGNPDADAAELRRVLKTTRLDGLVARLPKGLDTLVGHRGTKLSGGERQRVAIARALLRRPRLLLLDEATSQLDAVNEAALRETVADVARTTTVLVVAHRLSTVTMADRIVVMEEGRVRAVGTHHELVAADPLYAELAATQFLATADPPPAAVPGPARGTGAAPGSPV